MTSGVGPGPFGPYVVPDAIDDDPAPAVLETRITAALTPGVDVGLGGGLLANVETYNGTIPGPTLRLNVDDTVIVRLINELPYETGIHWHGIELANSADGTTVTQDGAVPKFAMPQPAPAPAGGTYLYKFKVPRPGLFWYHPHHGQSTNRVFKGLYGMIIVTDPNEAALIASGVLPGPGETLQLVLSDITVCMAVGSNDPETYATLAGAEWLSGVTVQSGTTPENLCEYPMDNPADGMAMDDEGNPALASYAAGDVPSIVRPPTPGTPSTVEGQTVLTNGMKVVGRPGTPTAPGAPPPPGPHTHPVLSGQGLRLQIVNCATTRYFRLILTTGTGAQVDLFRVGGEGGLLDNAIKEGGTIGTYNTKYTSGEILIPPASRADVVASIPAGEPVGSVLTLWTRDFQRTGPTTGNWAQLPTVPVMHLNVTGNAPTPYTIADGTPLRASIPGAAVEALPAPTPPLDALLIPSTFVPSKPGMPNPADPSTQNIRITTPPGINGVLGTSLHGHTPYTSTPHIGSSRYAEQGRVLELNVENTSNAHHPFHLHGFSFQPISLTGPGFTYTWPYREFRDNIDLRASSTLTFRVRLDDRKLKDGMTLGGALGRWLFHCHIFFHHHQGMISELVVSAADGSEKPNVDVGGSWAYAPIGGTATRDGTFSHPDGDLMTLTASKGTVLPAGPSAGGSWNWSFSSAPGDSPSTEYVYITATDPAGRKDQAVFRLKIGAPDDGADNGDPHVHTVDGKRYDFQGVGEFVLLRDRDGMEIQARHWPVQTATPITDSYSGLTSCVSVNTAVAARVGSHRIAYQPGRKRRLLQFYLDGEPAPLPVEGIVDGHRVTAYPVAGGATALRVDYAHHPVLTITPWFWNSYNIWILNVSVSHTDGDEGIMGRIPEDSWLPALPNGATVGPMPENLHERYVALYRTFANAWRVTDETSLFVYEPGTSTEMFTDEDWPAEKPPCELKPQFEVPGANPSPKGIPVSRAKRICQDVTVDGLAADCVFDVATTGDEDFAKAYLIEQDLKLHGSAVQIVSDKPRTRRGEPLEFTAVVMPLKGDGPTPTGNVTLLVDDVEAGPPVELDERGRASFRTDRLDVGVHTISAAYGGGGKGEHQPSTSPSLPHMVVPRAKNATLRRVLRFFNAARSPEDLAWPPSRHVAVVDERQEHGVHLDEPAGDHGRHDAELEHHLALVETEQPDAHDIHAVEQRQDHGGHGAEEQRSALLDRHLAAHVLKERDRKRHLYGFVHIRDLLQIEGIGPEVLDHILELFSPGVYGEWEVLYGGAGTPFEVAHAALLHTGHVLFIPESFAAMDTLLWDPGDPVHATALRTLSGATTGLTGVLFCGAHCFLQDGTLLVVGGGTSALGTTEAWRFDPIAETWQATAGSMSAPRWYPTTVVLGEDSGRVLVANGGPASMEIYQEGSDSFVPVHGPAGPGDTAADRSFPELYPGLHLLPTGQVFFTRTGNNTGTDPAAYFTFVTPTSGSWTGLAGGSAGDDRGRGMSLLLLRQQPTDPDRILVSGGGSLTTQATVGLIDNPPSSAAWVTGSFPDGLPRSSVNGVLLPDGKVLICGGRPTGGTPPSGGVCYLYDPSVGVGLGAFSEMDEVAYARQYHSVAVLLPSGKVMVTGGASQTIEVFSPPYLFNPDGTPASRPAIDTYPDPAVGTIILHGSTFEIGTAQAPDIAKIVMVRPMAVTHQTDAEQRVLSLSFSLTSPTTLSVIAPDGRIYPYAGGGGHTHVTAPRGYYMLFIINSSGVPSEARFVRLV